MSELFENSAKTELGRLGEFGLIEHLTKFIELQSEHSLRGVGDDAAVLDPKGKMVLMSTDMLLEGVHFNLAYCPLKHLGYKAVQVNLSDIYAMNAMAAQVTVSIGLSSRFPLEAVEEIYAGIALACKKYKVDLIGGDTSSSRQGLVLSLTSVGYADKDKIVYRDGARVHDLICVSGDLGAAYMGLQLLEREKRVFLENPQVQPDLEGKDYIVERQLKPESRRDVVDLLAKANVLPTAMIDVSDGLASELMHIAKASNVGVTIYEDKLPVDPMTYDTAIAFGIDATTCVLNGGEDYELLFTIKQGDYDKIKHDVDITVIGHVTDASEGLKLVTRSNTVVELKAQGWNAFNK